MPKVNGSRTNLITRLATWWGHRRGYVNRKILLKSIRGYDGHRLENDVMETLFRAQVIKTKYADEIDFTSEIQEHHLSRKLKPTHLLGIEEMFMGRMNEELNILRNYAVSHSSIQAKKTGKDSGQIADKLLEDIQIAVNTPQLAIMKSHSRNRNIYMSCLIAFGLGTVAALSIAGTIGIAPVIPLASMGFFVSNKISKKWGDHDSGAVKLGAKTLSAGINIGAAGALLFAATFPALPFIPYILVTSTIGLNFLKLSYSFYAAYKARKSHEKPRTLQDIIFTHLFSGSALASNDLYTLYRTVLTLIIGPDGSPALLQNKLGAALMLAGYLIGNKMHYGKALRFSRTGLILGTAGLTIGSLWSGIAGRFEIALSWPISLWVLWADYHSWIHSKSLHDHQLRVLLKDQNSPQCTYEEKMKTCRWDGPTIIDEKAHVPHQNYFSTVFLKICTDSFNVHQYVCQNDIDPNEHLGRKEGVYKNRNFAPIIREWFKELHDMVHEPYREFAADPGDEMEEAEHLIDMLLRLNDKYLEMAGEGRAPRGHKRGKPGEMLDIMNETLPQDKQLEWDDICEVQCDLLRRKAERLREEAKDIRRRMNMGIKGHLSLEEIATRYKNYLNLFDMEVIAVSRKEQKENASEPSKDPNQGGTREYFGDTIYRVLVHDKTRKSTYPEWIIPKFIRRRNKDWDHLDPEKKYRWVDRYDDEVAGYVQDNESHSRLIKMVINDERGNPYGIELRDERIICLDENRRIDLEAEFGDREIISVDEYNQDADIIISRISIPDHEFGIEYQPLPRVEAWKKRWIEKDIIPPTGERCAFIMKEGFLDKNKKTIVVLDPAYESDLKSKFAESQYTYLSLEKLNELLEKKENFLVVERTRDGSYMLKDLFFRTCEIMAFEEPDIEHNFDEEFLDARTTWEHATRIMKNRVKKFLKVVSRVPTDLKLPWDKTFPDPHSLSDLYVLRSNFEIHYTKDGHEHEIPYGIEKQFLQDWKALKAACAQGLKKVVDAFVREHPDGRRSIHIVVEDRKGKKEVKTFYTKGCRKDNDDGQGLFDYPANLPLPADLDDQISRGSREYQEFEKLVLRPCLASFQARLKDEEGKTYVSKSIASFGNFDAYRKKIEPLLQSGYRAENAFVRGCKKDVFLHIILVNEFGQKQIITLEQKNKNREKEQKNILTFDKGVFKLDDMVGKPEEQELAELTALLGLSADQIERIAKLDDFAFDFDLGQVARVKVKIFPEKQGSIPFVRYGFRKSAADSNLQEFLAKERYVKEIKDENGNITEYEYYRFKRVEDDMHWDLFEPEMMFEDGKPREDVKIRLGKDGLLRIQGFEKQTQHFAWDHLFMPIGDNSEKRDLKVSGILRPKNVLGKNKTAFTIRGKTEEGEEVLETVLSRARTYLDPKKHIGMWYDREKGKLHYFNRVREENYTPDIPEMPRLLQQRIRENYGDKVKGYSEYELFKFFFAIKEKEEREKLIGGDQACRKYYAAIRGNILEKIPHYEKIEFVYRFADGRIRIFYRDQDSQECWYRDFMLPNGFFIKTEGVYQDHRILDEMDRLMQTYRTEPERYRATSDEQKYLDEFVASINPHHLRLATFDQTEHFERGKREEKNYTLLKQKREKAKMANDFRTVKRPYFIMTHCDAKTTEVPAEVAEVLEKTSGSTYINHIDPKTFVRVKRTEDEKEFIVPLWERIEATDLIDFDHHEPTFEDGNMLLVVSPQHIPSGLWHETPFWKDGYVFPNAYGRFDQAIFYSEDIWGGYYYGGRPPSWFINWVRGTGGNIQSGNSIALAVINSGTPVSRDGKKLMESLVGKVRAEFPGQTFYSATEEPGSITEDYDESRVTRVVNGYETTYESKIVAIGGDVGITQVYVQRRRWSASISIGKRRLRPMMLKNIFKAKLPKLLGLNPLMPDRYTWPQLFHDFAGCSWYYTGAANYARYLAPFLYQVFDMNVFRADENLFPAIWSAYFFMGYAGYIYSMSKTNWRARTGLFHGPAIKIGLDTNYVEMLKYIMDEDVGPFAVTSLTTGEVDKKFIRRALYIMALNAIAVGIGIHRIVEGHAEGDWYDFGNMMNTFWPLYNAGLISFNFWMIQKEQYQMFRDMIRLWLRGTEDKLRMTREKLAKIDRTKDETLDKRKEELKTMAAEYKKLLDLKYSPEVSTLADNALKLAGGILNPFTYVNALKHITNAATLGKISFLNSAKDGKSKKVETLGSRAKKTIDKVRWYKKKVNRLKAMNDKIEDANNHADLDEVQSYLERSFKAWENARAKRRGELTKVTIKNKKTSKEHEAYLTQTELAIHNRRQDEDISVKDRLRELQAMIENNKRIAKNKRNRFQGSKKLLRAIERLALHPDLDQDTEELKSAITELEDAYIELVRDWEDASFLTRRRYGKDEFAKVFNTLESETRRLHQEYLGEGSKLISHLLRLPLTAIETAEDFVWDIRKVPTVAKRLVYKK